MTNPFVEFEVRTMVKLNTSAPQQEMHVVLTERVKTTLNTLSRDDREKVQVWLDYLRNWQEDEFVKSRSVLLNVRGQDMYLFRTSTEVRIFYTVDLPSRTVTVIDVTTKETILSIGAVATGVP